MAPTKPHTRMYADGHAYSLFDPEEIHRDMRLDPSRARVVLARSRQVAEAHAQCVECRSIVAEQAANPSPAAAGATYANLDDAIIAHSHRQTKFVLTRANLARLLQLGPGEHITRMYVSDDPQYLFVLVTGEHYQPVPDGTETPISRASRQG